MDSTLVIRSPQFDAVAVAWFSALCADDYEFLGVTTGVCAAVGSTAATWC